MDIPDNTNTDLVTVDLDTPIVRGETSYRTVQLRKPRAGELRGVKVSEVLQGDVNAHLKVLPRITQPTLTTPELEAMDPSDFSELMGATIGFFMTKGQREQLANI